MEKVYKTMRLTGAAGIAIGIVILVTGVVAGVLSIISGAQLLKNKKDLIF